MIHTLSSIFRYIYTCTYIYVVSYHQVKKEQYQSFFANQNFRRVNSINYYVCFNLWLSLSLSLFFLKKFFFLIFSKLKNKRKKKQKIQVPILAKQEYNDYTYIHIYYKNIYIYNIFSVIPCALFLTILIRVNTGKRGKFSEIFFFSLHIWRRNLLRNVY